MKTSLILILIATIVATANADDIQDPDIIQQEKQEGMREICFEGYVMDKFCIGRGTLLDQPSIVTLEEPDRHSLHCLVDVDRCRNSGYEMLLDKRDGSDLYERAFELDTFGNAQVVTLSRRVGDCTTCTGEGNQVAGFRATVRGFIIPDSGIPAQLRVTSVEESSVGCGEDGSFVPVNSTTSAEGSPRINPVSLHGGLMMTAWGFVLPSGVLSAMLLRHRGGPVWFRIHQYFQTIGYLLAVLGLIVAFLNFENVFADGMGPSYRHGVLGLCTMSCGLLQAVGGYFRPHAAAVNNGEKKSTARLAFEIGHKTVGYSAIILAYGTMYLGSTIAGFQRETFRGAWIGSLLFVAVSVIAGLVDKHYIHKGKPVQKEKIATKNIPTVTNGDTDEYADDDGGTNESPADDEK